MTILLFILGVAVGSFLNVVGLRYRSGLGLEGRSMCPACSKTLHWYELVPVASFILLRGKCSACKTHISWQYPLVEVATGIVFATLYVAFAPVSLLTTVYYILSTLVFCLYIAIVIYDLRHMIIPDPWVYTCVVLALGLRFITPHNSLASWLAGPALFAFFALIWLLTRGRAMGFGDAKLALSIGLLVGYPAALFALLSAFWSGSIVAVALLLLQRLRLLSSGAKRLTIKSEIPFAPFLVLGAWLSLVYHPALLHVLTF